MSPTLICTRSRSRLSMDAWVPLPLRWTPMIPYLPMPATTAPRDAWSPPNLATRPNETHDLRPEVRGSQHPADGQKGRVVPGHGLLAGPIALLISSYLYVSANRSCTRSG